jgi:DNA-binding PadR family transcriptional regulator
MARKTDQPTSFLPLPHLEFQILVSLADADLHGYAIVRQIEERSKGVPTPSTGSLYLAIARLLEAGLIAEAGADGDGGGRKKRTYCLSDLGRAVAQAESERLGELARLADERLRSREPATSSRGQR